MLIKLNSLIPLALSIFNYVISTYYINRYINVISYYSNYLRLDRNVNWLPINYISLIMICLLGDRFY